MPSGTSVLTDQISAGDCRRSTWAAGRDRLELVLDILGGGAVDPSEIEATLKIDPTRHQLAMVLWTDENRFASDGPLGVDQLTRLAAKLARVMGSERSLVVPAAAGEVWLWLTWSRMPAGQLGVLAQQSISPPPSGRVSMGPVATGVVGFRRSHLGAQEAARVARGHTPDVGKWIDEYPDIAVIAMLTRDPEQARWFVDETLGSLAEQGRGREELRETLRIYLSFGRSRLLASRTLHVARNTVAYRVDKAVKLLGRPIDDDPVTVRLALEIARALPVSNSSSQSAMP